MILSGAGLVEASEGAPINVHVAETTDKVYKDSEGNIYVITDKAVSNDPEATIYVMVTKDDDITTEPYIGKKTTTVPTGITESGNAGEGATPNQEAVTAAADAGKLIEISAGEINYTIDGESKKYTASSINTDFKNVDSTVVVVDYYTEKKSGAQQIDITPDKFGGNYYLEASTLFKNTQGVDMPAEFIIPNCKIQSNFTFTMASTGDPSSFTFTLDAFPDYTRFDKTKKVLAAIQIIDEGQDTTTYYRTQTAHESDHEEVIE